MSFFSRSIKYCIGSLASNSAKCLDLNLCLSLKECVVYFLDDHLYHAVANTVVQHLCLLLNELVTKRLERLVFLPVSQFVDQRVCLTPWPVCHQVYRPTFSLACYAVSRLALMLYTSANAIASVFNIIDH